MPRLGHDVTFFVVGASYDPSLVLALQNAPRTHYLGPQPAAVLAQLIRQADAVVMPNIPSSGDVQDVEGFGLVAIETSSLGGLLVASRLHGIKDAVQDGSTGTLVEPQNAPDWIRALKALLTEPSEARQGRRERAATNTREHYSRERMGQDFLKSFDSIL
jgi:glycosyltransferase involved in cell wall biosynthesis